MAKSRDFGSESLSEGQEQAAQGREGGSQPSAPAPTAPAPTQQAPASKVQEDPVFRSLPREIQVQVEAGMPLEQAVAMAAKAGGGAGAPAPQNLVDNAPALPLPAPSEVAGQQTRPSVPVTPGAGPERLTAGQVLEGGRAGRDTFARPGSQGFQPFSGQEFNPFLLRPEAQGVAGGALSARDALQTGDIGRQVIGSGGGFGGGGDPFLKDIIGG